MIDSQFTETLGFSQLGVSHTQVLSLFKRSLVCHKLVVLFIWFVLYLQLAFINNQYEILGQGLLQLHKHRYWLLGSFETNGKELHKASSLQIMAFSFIIFTQRVVSHIHVIIWCFKEQKWVFNHRLGVCFSFSLLIVQQLVLFSSL